MNKKLIITQRPELLLPERTLSSHANRLPHSREKEPFKPTDQWNSHQSGIFSHRHKGEYQNKPVGQPTHHRVYSSHQQSTCDRLNQTTIIPSSKQEVDLVALVSQLAKINTETQQRLSELSGRINRLEHSFNEFKGHCRSQLESKVEKSLEELYDIINRDFKASEDNIINHVREVRDEVRAVTVGKMEELTKGNENKYQVLSDQLQAQIKKGMQKVKDGIEAFQHRIQIEMNTLDLRECMIDRSRTSKTTAVRFTCLARSERTHQPLNVLEYLYYVTDDGHLTDEHGYHITDCKGEHISLTKEHLQKLRQAGILCQ